MLGRRMGRPGLLGTMARTTVIAGTATAVSGSIAHNQQRRYAEEEQQQQQAAVDAAAPMSESDQQIAEIAKFAKLRDSGVLSEEEFSAKKQQILGL